MNVSTVIWTRSPSGIPGRSTGLKTPSSKTALRVAFTDSPPFDPLDSTVTISTASGEHPDRHPLPPSPRHVDHEVRGARRESGRHHDVPRGRAEQSENRVVPRALAHVVHVQPASGRLEREAKRISKAQRYVSWQI